MFSKNSIFRQLPATLNRDELRFLEGLRFGIETADLSYRRLYDLVLDLTKRDASRSEVPEEAFPTAIADAWSTIDSMHRLKELLERTPKLKKTVPDIALFLRDAQNLTAMRNSFHHAREEIKKLPPGETAIWGVIMWCAATEHEAQILALAPGTVFDGQYPALNPLGQEVETPIDLITMKAFTRTAQLSGLHRRIGKLATYLETELRNRMTGMGGSICDVMFGMTVTPPGR